MLAHKLVFDEEDDKPFKLIAIHCSAEEYKLAFLLNKYLGLRLARARKDHDFVIKSVTAVFALYKYSHQKQYCDYYLISNKFKDEASSFSETGSLFAEETFASSTIPLLPEFKDVDYFLKIEEEYPSVSEKELLQKIKEIPQVATAYGINSNQLKFKENIIFD